MGGGSNNCVIVNVSHPSRLPRALADLCDGFSSNYELLINANSAGIWRNSPSTFSNERTSSRRNAKTTTTTPKWRTMSGRQPLLSDSLPKQTVLLLLVPYRALRSKKRRRKPQRLGYSQPRENVCMVLEAQKTDLSLEMCVSL